MGIIPVQDIGVVGTTTTQLWRFADNQIQGIYEEHTSESGVDINESITEDDKDMSIMRWGDYDKYAEQYSSRITPDIAYSVFSSSSFTDFTEEDIRFVNDGYDGTVHYSYYDKEGNKLDPDTVVKKEIIKSFLEDYEKKLRPGDVLVPKGHAVLYIGNNKVLHCNGGKIDVKTGKDTVENYENAERSYER